MEFIEFTLIDYPDALACSLYLRGCPLRCPHCHSWVLQEYCPVDWAFFEREVLAKIRAHQGMLEAFVLSGGEPSSLDAATLQRILGGLRNDFPDMKLGMHSAGYNPDMILQQFDERRLDWLGLDLKAPLLSADNDGPYLQAVGASRGRNVQLPKKVKSLLWQLQNLFGAETRGSVRRSAEIRLTLAPEVWSLTDLEAELRALRAAGFMPSQGFQIALQKVQPTERYPQLETRTEAAAWSSASSAFFQAAFLQRLHSIVPELILRQ